jgi:hypothetical protein
MTRLERRCRLLLLAYPASYRRERAEEMLGTLLEATPQGRSWPHGRDVRGLLVGGMRARAEVNRQLSLRVSLRTAAYAGILAFLGFISVANLGGFARDALTAAHRTEPLSSYNGPYLIALALIALTVALALADSRRVVVLIGALPAAAFECYGTAWPSHIIDLPYIATVLTYLAILVALSGRSARLRPRWRLAVGLVALSPLLVTLGPGRPVLLTFVLVVALGAICLAWIPVDARPATAACVFALVYWFPMTIASFESSAGGLLGLVPAAITLAIAALAAWRLRRQSSNAARQRI